MSSPWSSPTARGNKKAPRRELFHGHDSLVVQEATQHFRAAWMTQLTQRLRFDLTDTFAGHVELFTHFFQRVVGIHVDTETHTQHFCFTGGQSSQNVVRGGTQALGKTISPPRWRSSVSRPTSRRSASAGLSGVSRASPSALRRCGSCRTRAGSTERRWTSWWRPTGSWMRR